MHNRSKNLSKNYAQKKNEKTTKNEPNMTPKGLPEFPGKSQKSPPRRPRTSQEPPGIPKGPLRHPTATKRTSKDPHMSPQGAPNDPQRSPRDALRTHEGFQKTFKKAAKTTPQSNQNLKWKIDANVIATAIPPTQLSNNTASKMTSACRNARSDPPPLLGWRARPHRKSSKSKGLVLG